MVWVWILVSLLIFSVIVLIHEYGHYKTARIFKIHIEEFGLWIPPRAKKLWKNKTWTLFSLNWIPLWGFVKIAWESKPHFLYYNKNKRLLSLATLEKKVRNNDEFFDANWNSVSLMEKKYILQKIQSLHPGENFYEKNIWKKSLVLLAWVIMNFALAAVIFSVLFFMWVKPIWINTFIETSLPSKLIPTLDQSIQEWVIIQEKGIVLSPIDWWNAKKWWILKWDILLRVNDIYLNDIVELQTYISKNAWNEVLFYIKRTTECPIWSVQDTQCPVIELLERNITINNEWKIGTYLAPNYILQENFIYKYNISQSIKYGVLETYYQARLTLSGLWLLLKNVITPEKPEDRQEALNQVAGPIWIVWVITNALEWWFTLLILLWAIISVNLWVFNLLPIPALDGGRLLLLWIRTGIEKLFWESHKINNLENSVHVIFFLLLIALSILIAYNDIIKIFVN